MSPQSSGPGGPGKPGEPREPYFGRDEDPREEERYEDDLPDERAGGQDDYADDPVADERYAAASRRDDYDEGYDDRGDPGDAADGPYEDEYFDEDYDDEERPGLLQSGMVKAAVAGAALILFAGVVWYAYSLGRGDFSEGGELPVIAANPEPERVRPEDPGGLTIPHQDKLVLNEGEGQETVERLLPEPEQPQLPAEPAPDSGAAATPEEQLRAESEIESQQLDSLAEEQPAPAAEQQGGESQPEPEPESQEQPEAEPEDEAAAAETPPAPPEAPSSQPAAPGFVVGSPRGPFAIQLASVREQQAAVGAWERLQSSHPELLGQSELAVQRIEIDGQGTFYRLQAGPFPNRATAEDMCSQLSEAGQACLVVAR